MCNAISLAVMTSDDDDDDAEEDDDAQQSQQSFYVNRLHCGTSRQQTMRRKKNHKKNKIEMKTEKYGVRHRLQVYTLHFQFTFTLNWVMSSFDEFIEYIIAIAAAILPFHYGHITHTL